MELEDGYGYERGDERLPRDSRFKDTFQHVSIRKGPTPGATKITKARRRIGIR